MMFEHEAKGYGVLDIYPFVPEGKEPNGASGRVSAMRGHERYDELPTIVRFDCHRRDFKTLEEWWEYIAAVNAAVERAFAWLADQRKVAGGEE